LERLSDAAIYGGLFILGTYAFCLAFRRLPASVKAWLWWIACTQLLIRLFLTVPVTVPTTALPDVLPATPASEEPFVVSDGYTSAGAEAPPLPQFPSLALGLGCLWLVGVAGCSVVIGNRLIGARRLVRRSYPLPDGAEVEALRGLLRPDERLPRVLESSDVNCPLLIGLSRPSIVVPTGYGSNHTVGEMRMAFAHELAHIRRHDLWLASGIAATQALFFFHPLAWLATREAVIAREEACDLEALRLCGESSSAYAQFLLKSAQARTPVAALGAAYGYRNLRRRITMLKNTSSVPSFRRAWLLVVVAAVAASLPWSVVAQSTTPAVKKTTTKTAQAKKTQPAKAAAISKLSPVSKVVQPASADMRPVVGKLAPLSRTTPVAAPAPAQNVIRAQPAKGVLSKPARAILAPSPASISTAATPSISSDTIPPVPATFSGGATMAAAVESVLEVSLLQMAPDDPLQSKVTVNFDNANVERALIKLLSEADVDFVIKAKLQPETITARIKQMPVGQVLQMLLQGVDQPITFRIEGGVVFIINK
jgi:beta-lactamase regulating signal transducer with metallopeptidase domain